MLINPYHFLLPLCEEQTQTGPSTSRWSQPSVSSSSSSLFRFLSFRIWPTFSTSFLGPPSPMHPSEGRQFWDLSLGEEHKGSRLCLVFKRKPCGPTTAFPALRIGVCMQLKPKWDSDFHSAFIPHIFISLKRRGDCRARFGHV